MEITEKTIAELFNMLHIQESYTRKAYINSAKDKETQATYTRGIKNTLEMLLTDNFEKDIPDEYKYEFVPCFHVSGKKKTFLY